MNAAAESLLELPSHALRAVTEELSAGAAEQAADRLVEAMAVTREPYELRIRAQGLRELGSRLPDDAAARAADRLVEAMEETRDVDRWRQLAEGLRELGEKLPAASATSAARRLLEGIDPALRSRSWDTRWQLKILGDGLEALRYKIPSQIFEDAADRIVETVVAGQGPPCPSMKDFLTAMGERLDAGAAERLAAAIIDGLDATREPAPLSCLAELLGTQGDRLPADAVAQATDRIVEAMAMVAADELSYLLFGLRELGSRLPVAAADRAADRILEAMDETPDPHRSRLRKPERVRCLAQVLGALGEKLSDQMAERSLAAVVSAPRFTRHAYYDVDCESLCASAASLLRRDNLQPIVKLVLGLNCPPSSDREELVERIGEVVGESFGTVDDRFDERLSAFRRWARSEGYLP